MGEIILKTVATIIMMIGIIFIYDARIISKKLFSFGDQNEATMTMKIVGFIATIISGILIICLKIWLESIYNNI